MKAFHYLASAAALLFAFTAASCSDNNDEPEPEVINHIYFSIPDGNSSITDNTDETVTVAINLSSPLATATSFTVELTGSDASLLTLGNNPVSIAAGATTGTFTVASANAGTITESTSFGFTIRDLDPAKFDIAQNATVTLLPAVIESTLTPEEQALVNQWRTAYGIDLTPWIGSITLQGTIEFPGSGNRAPFIQPQTIQLSGNTVFGISKLAAETPPVLDMTENPMGMTEYLYKTLRQLTVDDNEYFALEDDGTGLELMELIDWNAKSEESFTASLPGLRITNINDGKATVEFVAEGDDYILNAQGEPIYSPVSEEDLVYAYHTSWIPFTYQFTAWNRQLALIEGGDPLAMELQSYGVSAAPAAHLGISDVLEDAWEIDEDEDGVANLYVAPHAEIDFNAGTMTFVFPFDSEDQYGYSRITVTYTLQK
ncbi:MAG: DUF4929 domain-containing protein [Paramuribaculum sp.]|nr:DUF4929 domain-containing protein [Paramuribaculum sp.]